MAPAAPRPRRGCARVGWARRERGIPEPGDPAQEAVSNQSLRDGARGLDAAYSIELVQDCLSNNRMQAVFQLRLVRVAQVARAPAGRDASVGGGVQLVCRYTLYFGRDERAEHQFDHMLSKSVLESFATAETPHDKNADECKEHARLLVHLMLFCVASARKRVSTRSVDPGIVSVLRDYDTFSHFDYHGWDIDNHEMDIQVVEDEKLDNESRCLMHRVHLSTPSISGSSRIKKSRISKAKLRRM